MMYSVISVFDARIITYQLMQKNKVIYRFYFVIMLVWYGNYILSHRYSNLNEDMQR